MIHFFRRNPLLPGFKLSLGVSVLFISLVILLPISALMLYSSEMGWEGFWLAISDPRVVASYRVTLSAAGFATVTASLIGFLLAWILSRYQFPGRHLLEALVDLPFALPTAVAGLTLATLTAPQSWLGKLLAPYGIQIAYAFPGIVLAMTFTSLPFVIRALQPVLQDLHHDKEEAAKTLGATPWQTFKHVIFPYLRPALIVGASQAFIRSLGEFGAIVLIAGNIPLKTEVTSLMIFIRLSEYEHASAAAIATIVLFSSLCLLFLLQLLQAYLLRWNRQEVKS